MKQAQTTVFMILGIMILLAAGFGIYLATQTVMKPKMATTESAVQEYVQECIKQTATEAIKLIGDNAGYTSIENNPYRTFQFRTEAAEGDGIPLSEFGLYAIPYWWHMKTPNTCNNCYLTSDNMPVIPEIEEQINTYVTEHIDECITDGIVLEGLAGYSIEAKGEPEIETQIGKEKTTVTAKYPIEAVRGETKTKIDSFASQIDINLGGMLELAQEIIELEKEKAVFEEGIMHMLGAHMGASFEKLPPTSEITHEYYLVQWTKELVELQAKQILNSYTPLIRFARTKNENTIEKGGKYAKGFYNALQIKGLKKDYPFDASISYNDWPIYFGIKPDSMTGTSHKQSFYYDIMQPFQTNTYEFYYDISMPLLVQITDDKALNSEGYTITFAVEANIRDNKDMAEWNKGEGTLGPWNPARAQTKTTTTERRYGECVQNIRKYKCSIDEKNYDTLMQCTEMCYTARTSTEPRKPAQTKFCTPEQKLSGEITVNVKSGGKGTEGALVSYTCGNYQSCTLGVTDSTGMISSKMPLCQGGVITAAKQGHYTEKAPLATRMNEAKTLEFNLKQEKEYTIQYRKYKMEKDSSGNKTLGKIEKPGPGQTAMISIERVKETPISAEYSKAVMLTGDETGTIKLTPGTYKISIKYLDETGIVIPEGCKEICTNEEDGDCFEYKKLPEEDMIIKPAMLGGAELDSETGYWTVTDEMINSEFKNVQVYAIETVTPTCIDTTGCINPSCTGLDEMGKAKEYSLRYRSYLEPKMQ